MKSWTNSQALRNRLRREWDKGRLLAFRLNGEERFPLKIPLRRPNSLELGERYGDVKGWIDELIRHSKPERGTGYSIDWREVNHRQLGKNRLPVAAVFEREDDALDFIRRRKEADRFRRICERTLDKFPVLQNWLAKKPLSALEHYDRWPMFLAVLEYFRANPRPNLYVRQLEIEGVDTKFIERHKKLLGELLDIVLPAEAIERSATKVTGFERRYGLLPKPIYVHFRLLDPKHYVRGLSDLQVPVEEFRKLDPAVKKIFIVENEINGLAFPPVKDALAIFGLGYGLDRLGDADWLRDKELHYWGDIDTHGFAMLDRARHVFPQVRSLLMDRATLMAHRSLWGSERTPANRNLNRLTQPEAKLYDDIKNDRLAKALRLEQERISYTHLKNTLSSLT